MQQLSAGGIDWNHYLRLVLRQKWFVLVPLLVGTSFSWVISLLLMDQYQARATILVEPQSIPTDFMKSTLPFGPETYVRSLVEQIKSVSRLEKVIQEYDLYADLRKKATMEEVVNRMRDKIQVERRANDTFSVAFTGEDPIKVEAVANALTDLFIQENLNYRLSLSVRNVEFFEKRARELRDQVAVQERKIQEFKSANLDRLPEQRESTRTQLTTTEARLQACSTALADARAQLSAMQERRSRISGYVQVGGSRPKTDPLVIRLEKEKQELEALKVTYSDKHPDVRAKQKVVDQLSSQVDARPGTVPGKPARRVPNAAAAQVSEELEVRAAEVTRLEAEEQRLKEQVALLNQRLEDTPRIELELSKLGEGLRVRGEQADSFQKKATEAAASLELEKANQGSQFRTLDKARRPVKPVSPNRPMLVGLGAALGLGLGLLMVVGLDLVFRPFLDEKELYRFTGVPVLVSIPHVGQFPSEWQRLLGQLSMLINMITSNLPFTPSDYASRLTTPLPESDMVPERLSADTDRVAAGRAFTYLTGEPTGVRRQEDPEKPLPGHQVWVRTRGEGVPGARLPSGELPPGAPRGASTRDAGPEARGAGAGRRVSSGGAGASAWSGGAGAQVQSRSPGTGSATGAPTGQAPLEAPDARRSDVSRLVEGGAEEDEGAGYAADGLPELSLEIGMPSRPLEVSEKQPAAEGHSVMVSGATDLEDAPLFNIPMDDEADLPEVSVEILLERAETVAGEENPEGARGRAGEPAAHRASSRGGFVEKAGRVIPMPVRITHEELPRPVLGGEEHRRQALEGVDPAGEPREDDASGDGSRGQPRVRLVLGEAGREGLEPVEGMREGSGEGKLGGLAGRGAALEHGEAGRAASDEELEVRLEPLPELASPGLWRQEPVVAAGPVPEAGEEPVSSGRWERSRAVPWRAIRPVARPVTRFLVPLSRTLPESETAQETMKELSRRPPWLEHPRDRR